MRTTLQDGGGNGGGGGGRIVVKSGDVVVVRLFVVIVVSPVKMVDVGKPGQLFSGHYRALLVQDPDALLPPSHLPPDNVAVVKRVIVVLVLVFVVQA